MILLKCLVVLVVSCRCGFAVIRSTENKTANQLGNLPSYSIQSRQIGKNPYYPNLYQNHIIKNQDLNNFYTLNQPVPIYAKPYPYNPVPNVYNQNFLQHTNRPYPYRPGLDQRESIMDILYSVARNDDLQCVPKILCDITSGTLSGRQSGLNLPININMDSLIGFLSGLNGVQSSPILHFGKAALLGYSSRGNSHSCRYAYPQCPSDPDRLIQYLNNHNGGFFRYFNGFQSNKHQNYASFHQGSQYFQNYPANPYQKRTAAEDRIQNQPVKYIPLSEEYQKLAFPNDEENSYYNSIRESKNVIFPLSKPQFSIYKTQNALKFPEETYEDYPEQPFRKPKELPFDISFYHQNSELLDLQKPLPNHQATPLIFPTRTGTGELRFDDEEFENRVFPAYEDQDIKINIKGVNIKNAYNYNRFDNRNRRENYLKFYKR